MDSQLQVFLILYALLQQEEIPLEFDLTFKKHFWDILA